MAIGAILTGVSIAAQVGSSITGYLSNKDAASSEAAALRAQAAALRTQGDYDYMNARLSSADLSLEAARMNSAQIVAGAGSGVSLTGGTFTDLLSETASMYEQDMNRTMIEGEYNRDIAYQQAAAYEDAAKAAEKAGSNPWGAITSGIGGIASGAAGWFA